jgi:hypothetical protein
MAPVHSRLGHRSKTMNWSENRELGELSDIPAASPLHLINRSHID